MGRPKSVTRIARAIQQICEEETGTRPKYAVCLRIADESSCPPGIGEQEHACRLYVAHQQAIIESGAQRPIRKNESAGCR
jgi:hypothetical protein